MSRFQFRRGVGQFWTHGGNQISFPGGSPGCPLSRRLVTLDASSIRWGYQSSWDHQDSGAWNSADRLLHINVRQLIVSLFFLQENTNLENEAICFDMDNTTAVLCLARQGTSRSETFLSLSERLFAWQSLCAFPCRPCTFQRRTISGQMHSSASRVLQWNGPSKVSVLTIYAGGLRFNR